MSLSPTSAPRDVGFARFALLGAFALSGFSGLMYESVWASYLKLLLGHAALAQTLVLVIFMGGMALGSWVSATYGVRWRNLLLGYAIVEGAVGIAGLAFHGVFDFSMGLAHETIMPALGDPTLVVTFKWVFAAALVLPQSIALGMTFPLMSGALARRLPGQAGNTIASLYFANSLGAAIGVLISGFILIPSFGLPGTVLSAGAINIFLALGIWLLSKDAVWNVPPAQPESSDSVHIPAAAGRPWLLLSIAFVTGVASFVYEIGWIRMLSLVLGASTHAFELMLSAFILGLALGSAWIRNRIDGFPDPLRTLGVIQVIMGVLALGTIVVYGATFELMANIMTALARNDAGYTLFNLSSHAIALLVMLPVTFCAGMTLPLITAMLLRNGFGERAIGHVYAANTAGAIVGVIIAVHILLPLVGLKFLICAGAALDIVAGLVILQRVGANRFTPVLTGVAVASLIGVGVFTQFDLHQLVSGVFRYGRVDLVSNAKIRSYEDGKTASVSLLEFPNGVVSVLTNGKSDAAIQLNPTGALSTDELTMTMIAGLALGAHPQANNAAVIGFGAGMSTHTALASRHIKQIDTIEIEPKMYEAARAFHAAVPRAFDDPRSHVYFDDARTFFSTHATGYDIIMSEPSNPWVSGIATLFTQEFYARAKANLNADGVFVQWIHGFEISLPLLSSTVNALGNAFEDYTLYNLNDRDLLFIAGSSKRVHASAQAMFAMPELASDLARIGVSTSADVSSRYLGSRQTLAPLFASFGVPPNSDYFPVLDTGAVKARYLKHDVSALIGLRNSSLPVIEVLEPQHVEGGDSPLTPSKLYASSARWRDTQAFVASLASGHETWAGTMSGEFETLRVNGELLWPTCGSQPFRYRWIRHVADLTRRLAATLTPDGAAQLVARLKPTECGDALSAGQSAQLGLLEALAARDSQGIATAAEQFLGANELRDDELRKLPLKAALLGNLGAGKHARAKAIAKRLLPPADPDSDDVELQLLRALSLRRAG